MQNTKDDSTASPSRRNFVKGAGALGALSLFGGVAPAVMAKSTAPLKFGALNTYSKVYAGLGNANLNGMQLYFDQIGNTIAGRKIQILKEDDELNPQVGLQKLKQLVESDQCDLITGIQGSNIAMAAVQYLRASNPFLLCSGAGVTELSYTGLPYLFRCSQVNYPTMATMANYFYDNIDKRAVLTTSDFSGGRDGMAGFKAQFEKRGGIIVKEIYPPLGNNDFAPYLADIRNADAKATFSFYAGTDAVRFVKQYDEYGLRQKYRLTGSGFMVESDVLPAEGSSALGTINMLHYAETLDNPENKKFVADHLARYKDYPSVYAEYGYVAARVLHLSLEAVDGNAEDKNKLREAMRAVKFNAPRGPFRFTPETQGPTHNIYIREVAEIDGRLTNKVIATFKDVPDPPTRPVV